MLTSKLEKVSLHHQVARLMALGCSIIIVFLVSTSIFILSNVQKVDPHLMNVNPVNAIVKETTLLLSLGGVLMIGFYFFSSMIIRRIITKPLFEATELAQKLAQGDLTSRLNYTKENEIGLLLRSISDIAEKFSKSITDVADAAEFITFSAEEISNGNHDLAKRTDREADNLEQTTSSLEELTAMVKQNADNSSIAAKIASEASGVAERGGEAVSRVVNTMQDINASSKKINDIITVIDGIAFQTNILALNAAVEAARAGEQGRGFAVVASEVRSLAQRSAAAAKEIKTLIQSSTEKVEIGYSTVAQAGETMQEVVKQSAQVQSLINEISTATREQSQGVEVVNKAMLEIDEGTQQNAALVAQSALAAQSLKDEAKNLVKVVSFFKTKISDSGNDLGGLDVAAAIGAHLGWKKRLINYVNGNSTEQLDPNVIACDDKCALGKWIYGHGKTFQNEPIYSDLKGHHADFHQCAASVVRFKLAGNPEKATETLNGDFSKCSNSTVADLRKIRHHLEK